MVLLYAEHKVYIEHNVYVNHIVGGEIPLICISKNTLDTVDNMLNHSAILILEIITVVIIKSQRGWRFGN